MKKHFIPLILLACILSSCNKNEGTGGNSTLQGYLYLVMHNDDDYNLSVDTFPAAKSDVFITYGGDSYFGDDIEAGPDGFYQFKYLTKGDYTIFSYSTLTTGEKIAVEKKVKVGSGTTTVENIYIHEGKAYGTSIIKGKIYAQYWNKKKNDYENQVPATDTRVYVQRVGDDFPLDDVRTSNEGVFLFQKLLPGEYIIYTYSADRNIVEDDEEAFMQPKYISMTGSSDSIITITKGGEIINLPPTLIIDIL